MFDALTARLGASLGGGVVLDLYAGTGALGLEALSRGVTRAVFVESAPPALKALAANVDALGAAEGAVVVAGDATTPALERAREGGPFTLLLIDPPYRIDPAAVASVIARCETAVAPGALLVWEHAGDVSPEPLEGWRSDRTYRHGDTAVTFFVASGSKGV
jgi:16S rRNA (guanine966-N2)-methyltransferase